MFSLFHSLPIKLNKTQQKNPQNVKNNKNNVKNKTTARGKKCIYVFKGTKYLI